MWDPVIGTVHVTRDVVWLKEMYYKEQQGGETLVLEPTRIEGKAVKWIAEVCDNVKGVTVEVCDETAEDDAESKGESGSSIRDEGKTRYRRQVKKPTLY